MIKKNENLTKQAVEGSFWAGFATFLNRFASLFFSILFARLLLPENFGLYSLTMSIAFIFMTFADLGINETLIRFFSLYKNKEKSTAYFQYIFKIKILLSFLVSLILFLGAYPLSFFIFKKPELFYPLIVASIFILSSLFVYFFSSFFYAIKKTKYIGINEIFFQLVRIILIIFVFILISSEYHVIAIIIASILTNLFVLLLLLSWLKKLAPGIFKKSNQVIDKKSLLKFLGYATIAQTSGIFFSYIDTLMLGFFVSFSYLGYYRIAFSLVFGVIGLFTYLSVVLMPFFTRLENKRLKRAFNKSVRFILIFSIPSAFGILALGRYFIRLLYGYEYLQAQYPFYVLSFLLILWIPTTLLMTLFFSKGKIKEILKIKVFALVLNVLLNFVLIYSLMSISELWAVVGASIATLLSWVFIFVSMIIISRKKLNISLEKIIFVKPIISGIIMFLSLYFLNRFLIRDMTLVLGVLEIIVGALIYLILMYLIKGITREDMETLKKLPVFTKIQRFKELKS